MKTTYASNEQVSSIQMYCHSSNFFRDNSERNQAGFVDLGELDQSTPAFYHEDAADLSSSSMFSLKPSNVAAVPNNLHFSSLNMVGSAEVASRATGYLDAGQFVYHKGTVGGLCVNGFVDSLGDSGMADKSQHNDSSTDVDTDEKSQNGGVHCGALAVVDSAKAGDQKVLRRLAQNREAARKSRLRKKAYVQQLENGRLRLVQLEQDLLQARQQGSFQTNGLLASNVSSLSGNGALAFDMEYARWLDEHQRLINELRSAYNSQVNDDDLRAHVDNVISYYDELFKLKSIGAKADVFHILSGMWKTPAERCFMWLGGFRSSEILTILGNHLEPLTDHQLLGVCNLRQSSQQAEDALSQGMEALQQSLVETLSFGSSRSSDNVADYMGQMAIAMGKLSTLENFVHQADLLRQQTLQQMHRILTTRQAARAFLVISDYASRLRALSSLWQARPRN